MKRNICFIVNADETIGIGHFIRVLALAEEFAIHDYQVNFITNTPFVFEKCEEKNHLCFCIHHNGSAYESALIKILNDLKIDVLVFDLIEDQLIKHKFIGALQNILKVSLSIFNYSHKRFEDICIYPGLSKIEDNLYNETTRKNIPYYSGPEYLIIRDEFNGIGHKTIRSFANKILITMGGSDPGNLTDRALESIMLLHEPVLCDIVLGKNFKNKKDIYYKHGKTNFFSFYEDVDYLSDLMFQNDIALINGGTTRYELSIVGTPYISISLNKTQFNITEKLARQNACINLAVSNSLKNHEIASSITHLLKNFELRKNISKNMRCLFDLEGKQRIFKIIDSYPMVT
jgi:spore coat polysaccharide biosynthesis predicted glycosyltransferase SpsG